jgi:hypothetical protein
MNEIDKLSREEKAQLEAANAEALEKEVASLGRHLESGGWNYRAFWEHSDIIHKAFQRVRPLSSADRKRLWKIFSMARDLVKQKQDVERKYTKWLLGLRREAIKGYLQELNELLQKESKNNEDVDLILHFLESLNLMMKEGWEGYPDTPDVAMLSCRSEGKYSGREMMEEASSLEKLRKKCAAFLSEESRKMFDAIALKIAEAEKRSAELSSGRLKSLTRELKNEIFVPILNKSQKEKLLRRVEKLQKMTGRITGDSEENGNRGEEKAAAEDRRSRSEEAGFLKNAPPAAGLLPAEKIRRTVKSREVEALLTAIEMDLLKRK